MFCNKGMIELIPEGLCSYNYEIRSENFEGKVLYKNKKDQGECIIGEEKFSIKTERFWDREWKFIKDDQVIAIANKRGKYKFEFILDYKGREYIIKQHWGGKITSKGSGCDITLKRKHLGTRRAEISGQYDSHELLIMTTWLSGLIIKKSSEAAAASGAAGAAAAG